VDGAGGARGLGALVQEVGQGLREGTGLLEVLGRHPDLAVGADTMARARGEPLALDDGAARLGEIALVDDSSPLQQAGVLFYDTLLDESAASHIAWGDGIPDGHRDCDPARPETLDGLPINHSGTHVDFMIGSPDLTVTGVCRDGTRRDVLEAERRVL
jgi:aminopeptidase